MMMGGVRISSSLLVSAHITFEFLVVWAVAAILDCLPAIISNFNYVIQYCKDGEGLEVQSLPSTPHVMNQSVGFSMSLWLWWSAMVSNFMGTPT